MEADEFLGADTVPNPESAEFTLANLAADLSYVYDGGDQRRVKTARDLLNGTTSHAVYVFGSLELRRTAFGPEGADIDGGADDYIRNEWTETVYLFANGARLARLAYEESTPSVSDESLHVFLELGDHLGSTSAVLDLETSELVERSTYQAYGGTESDYRPARWKNFREDYRFTGKEEDVEVGLVYFGKRFLNTQIQRWVSADPLEVHAAGEADANLYAYVSGQVLKAVDPLGLREYVEDPVSGEGSFVSEGAVQSCDGGGSYCNTNGDVVGDSPLVRDGKLEEWTQQYAEQITQQAWDKEEYEKAIAEGREPELRGAARDPDPPPPPDEPGRCAAGCKYAFFGGQLTWDLPFLDGVDVAFGFVGSQPLEGGAGGPGYRPYLTFGNRTGLGIDVSASLEYGWANEFWGHSQAGNVAVGSLAVELLYTAEALSQFTWGAEAPPAQDGSLYGAAVSYGSGASLGAFYRDTMTLQPVPTLEWPFVKLVKPDDK
jgi:RHS repeat-associated protein